MHILIVVALAVFGITFGSFVNALVWRVHEQEELKDKKQTKAVKKQLEELSIVRGRSMCLSCNHQLAAKDLVPIFSWIALKGRCRYCHAHIPDTPISEVLTPILFVVSYVLWPDSFHGYSLLAFVLWLAFLVGFVALALYDIRWYILPDRIIFPLIGLAVIQVAAHLVLFHGGMSAAMAAVWGVLVASGFYYLLYQVSRGTWIGGGDIKLGVILGLLLGGPLASVLLLFFASVFGTMYSLPLLVTGKLKTNAHIPFGPFLLLATVWMQLWGVHVIHWLNTLIIP